MRGLLTFLLVLAIGAHAALGCQWHEAHACPPQHAKAEEDHCDCHKACGHEQHPAPEPAAPCQHDCPGMKTYLLPGSKLCADATHDCFGGIVVLHPAVVECAAAIKCRGYEGLLRPPSLTLRLHLAKQVMQI